MTLVTKRFCGACEELKKRIDNKELGKYFEVLMTNNSEGMAFAALHELLDQPVPILVIENPDSDIAVIVKDLEEIGEIIQSIEDTFVTDL